ncbi:uncharacterized protein LOC125189126 isoform X2 [Salvia hispanica]|uniref:uncharacterized protein LOC125189126 isoform X2 n=1 Tax=Salvia hispanica TaxID=49212 RepID=UPI002009581B|nr:uncharacterized protein LOC125189126 isoform X2 [Salvia hispanica]
MESDESTAIPIQWSHEANWIIAHGSLQSTVTVESSDHPIAEPDSENTATKFPLILKPPTPDFGHCEIKICFKQTYEVRQIYVRSTARAYEIYYATSPNSINEYLSTVRCGVAERDDKVLQTSCVEAEEHGDSLSGDVAAETASSGGSTATSEDDWVNIKVPGTGSSPASDKTNTIGVNNVQDFYEATAQISDSEPCLSLTIRLLSLHDKGHVYVDEVYVFVDPVESTDSGNGAALAGGSAQNSLMAMFMPTLLQLSKSGVSRAQEKSDEVLKNSNMELVSTTTDRIDSPQQVLKPKEVCKDNTESAEHQQHTSAKKYCMAANENSFQPSHLETAMEQLVSRLSRVEDICLRFEEKMLKPIERIEERLQQVENQLEKLAKSSHESGLPHCTRISAPEFSCSGSDTSSFYNNELEKKDFTSDDLPDTPEANFNPGLIITAPEFSYGEEEEDNDDLKPLEDSHRVEPKKTLSIDDALAAALNGFMSSAVSEPIQIPIGLLGDENEEIQYQGHAKFCQTETREFPAAESGSTESSQNVQVFTIEAPDFSLEETGGEEQLNSVQSLSDVASVTEKENVDFGNEMVPLSNNSADTSDFGIKESTDELVSPSNGNSPAASNGCLNTSSKVNVIETYFEGNTTSGRDQITSSSAPSPPKDSTDTSMHQISDESNLGKLSSKPDDQDAASQEIIGQEAKIVSESEQQHVAVESSEDDAEHVSVPSHAASFLDFELPILEVKFTSELRMGAKSALEALLDDEASESNTEAPLTDMKKVDGICVDGHETIDVLSKNCLLVDLEVSAEDTAVSSPLEGAPSHSLSHTSSSEMDK